MKWIWFFLLATFAKGDVPYVNILQYENVTIADADMVCSYFKYAKISEKCWEQLEIVCANPTLLMTILDASSKFPYPGLGYSIKADYGNYDQCMTVDHSYSGGRILGEFCAIGLIIPDILSNFSSYFTLAVCRPNECSANDYNAILKHLLSVSEDFTGLFIDQSCTTVGSNSTFSTGDIIVVSIFGIVIFLMVVSTSYDVCLYHLKFKSIHPLCLAFSVLSNGRKLLHISKHSASKEQIETFHGMRVISMMWIVAGHGMGTWMYGIVTNSADVNDWMKHLSAFHMTAAPLSVDTFFYMSGFLLAFQYFKGKTRTFFGQVISVPYMITHRYLRLTPAVLMVFLMTITFFIHLGSGPLYPAMAESYSKTCTTHWWRVFLYIQNYYKESEMCLLQTWYLSADMQMFLISPLILIPMSISMKKFGFRLTMCGLLIFNIFLTFLPMVLKLTVRDYTNDYDTHSRLINYFIGVMLGTFMRVQIDKPFLYMVPEKLRYIYNLTIWILVLFGMLAITICYQDQQMHHGFESQTVFEALMRPAWCIGLCWITYSCYHGYGGFVNWILTRPIFQVVGRLTYCIYLVHLSVIIYDIASVRTKSYFNEYNSFYKFCGHYVVSALVATFWTLAFESPLIIIEKYLLGGLKPGAREDHAPKIVTVEQQSAHLPRRNIVESNKL